MKKIITFLTVFFVCICASAQDGKSIYNRYSEAQGVSAVYISPAMFRMMGKLPDMDMGSSEVNLTSLVKSLSGFYLINSENATINDDIRKDVEKFVKSGHYELMMEAKDDGEVVRIFTAGKKDVITSFVFLAHELGECTFICLDANMSRDQLESLLGSM